MSSKQEILTLTVVVATLTLPLTACGGASKWRAFNADGNSSRQVAQSQDGAPPSATSAGNAISDSDKQQIAAMSTGGKIDMQKVNQSNYSAACVALMGVSSTTRMSDQLTDNSDYSLPGVRLQCGLGDSTKGSISYHYPELIIYYVKGGPALPATTLTGFKGPFVNKIVGNSTVTADVEVEDQSCPASAPCMSSKLNEDTKPGASSDTQDELNSALAEIQGRQGAVPTKEWINQELKSNGGNIQAIKGQMNKEDTLSRAYVQPYVDHAAKELANT